MNVCVAHLQMNACVVKNFGAWTEKVGHPCYSLTKTCYSDLSHSNDSSNNALKVRFGH